VRGNPVPVSQQTEPLRAALEALLRMPDERYTDDQWEVLGAILELLPRAAAHLKVVFASAARPTSPRSRKARCARSAHLNPRLTSCLRSTRAAPHPGRRIPGHLLVAIRAAALPHLRLGERRRPTLFLVGDPMQSIYRFREAKVALFLQVWESGKTCRHPRGAGVQLERLTLTTNFRSQAGLVDWYNASFPRSCRASRSRLGRRAVLAGFFPSFRSSRRRGPVAPHARQDCRRIESDRGTRGALRPDRNPVGHVVPLDRVAGKSG